MSVKAGELDWQVQSESVHAAHVRAGVKHQGKSYSVCVCVCVCDMCVHE